jgi:hypothetical protein
MGNWNSETQAKNGPLGVLLRAVRHGNRAPALARSRLHQVAQQTKSTLLSTDIAWEEKMIEFQVPITRRASGGLEHRLAGAKRRHLTGVTEPICSG